MSSWHHVARARGHRVDSIGKLHFHLVGEDHGFTEDGIPMHIIGGKGDLMGLVRQDMPKRGGAKKMAAMVISVRRLLRHRSRQASSRYIT